VHLSTHYYVLSLSERMNALYEAFRDAVIDIRNGGFPVKVSLEAHSSADSINREERLREALLLVDQHFGNCYRHDPLKLIVTGEREMQDLFASVTAHRNAIIGRVKGDYSTTSLHDVGKIVWPVVKEAVSGLLDSAMRDLEAATKGHRTVCGINSVSQQAVKLVNATLLVEDDYHVRGSISRMSQSLEISQDVDVREEMDDAIDVVIERVLESGGNVIFTPNGSLHGLGRIVLVPRGSESSR
jgi:hypothetical protein